MRRKRSSPETDARLQRVEIGSGLDRLERWRLCLNIVTTENKSGAALINEIRPSNRHRRACLRKHQQ